MKKRKAVNLEQQKSLTGRYHNIALLECGHRTYVGTESDLRLADLPSALTCSECSEEKAAA